MSYDIFISYAKEDEARAQFYALRFQKAGLKVFFAPQALRNTENNLQVRLLHEVGQARNVLLIWSRWLENSQWVALETSIYATKRLTDGNAAIRLVAVDFGGSQLPGWLPCDLVVNPKSDSSLEDLFRSGNWPSSNDLVFANQRSLLKRVRHFALLTRSLLFEPSLWMSTWRKAIPRLNPNFSLAQIRADEIKTPLVKELVLELVVGTSVVCFLITIFSWILSSTVFSPSYVPDWRGYINKEVLLIGLFAIASGIIASLRIGFGAALAGSLLAASLGSATTLVLGWIRSVERPDPIASGAAVGITLGSYAAMAYVLGRCGVGSSPRRTWNWSLVSVVFASILTIAGVQALATRLGDVYHYSSSTGRAGVGLAFGGGVFLPLAVVAAVVAYLQRRGYLWRSAVAFGSLLWASLSIATAVFAAFLPDDSFDLLNVVGVGLIAGAATAGMATFVYIFTEPAAGQTWGMSLAVAFLLLIGLPFLRLAPNIRPVLVYKSIIVTAPVTFLLVVSMQHRKRMKTESAEAASD